MSNDKEEISRLYKLQAKINMMVVDGTRNPKSVADTLQQILEEKQQYLRHLETLTLAPTKGNVMLTKTTKVFIGYLDSNFKNCGTEVSGIDTVSTKVDVYEVSRNGNYWELFGSIGDPRKFCLTQGQIMEFCCSHRDSLRQEGLGTFFLFEVKGELFVAGVFADDDGLMVSVNCFADASIWHAEYRPRVVVKQQTV